ncbi:hypothetical protein F5883DRAFT_590730 [Diaporthe sp. PMI_573]|nr:hypothetical protein F5883DRAFT_590730 [Diaporthaceae sp. PMI_573]
MTGVALGVASAVSGFAQQSIWLLDRIQKTLEHRKQYSAHLGTVIRDVAGTKAIVKRIEENPFLHTDVLATCIEELLRISQDLDTLVAKQEEQTQKGKGFRLFLHDFLKGPDDQQKLEAFRDNLVASKNTLTLAIVVDLSPAGTVISVSDTKLSDTAYMQNILRKEHQADKGSGRITIQKVQLGGSSLMLNTTLDPEQIDKVTDDNEKRKRIEILGKFLTAPEVASQLKSGILSSIQKLVANE